MGGKTDRSAPVSIKNDNFERLSSTNKRLVVMPVALAAPCAWHSSFPSLLWFSHTCKGAHTSSLCRQTYNDKNKYFSELGREILILNETGSLIEIVSGHCLVVACDLEKGPRPVYLVPRVSLITNYKEGLRDSPLVVPVVLAKVC